MERETSPFTLLFLIKRTYLWQHYIVISCSRSSCCYGKAAVFLFILENWIQFFEPLEMREVFTMEKCQMRRSGAWALLIISPHWLDGKEGGGDMAYSLSA